MKSFLDAMKKRFDSDKSLSKSLEEKDRLERELMKKREQVTGFLATSRLFQMIFVVSEGSHRTVVWLISFFS